jgi:glycosyltransferase involved in cell wall biosynthesis
MKIAYIGTYPPRECGIGTFTQNKFMAMINHGGQDSGHEGFVVAVNDQHNTYDYPEEVQYVIRQDQQSDYLEAAEFINRSGADICILEHEFGIFGGDDGVYLLSLLHQLEIPLISVFHTVLKTPSPNQKKIVTEVAWLAAKVVVMSNKAVEFLTGIYGIARERIKIIEHGVPDLQFEQEASKKEFGLENKKVLLTFGLIGRNKGIETVIKALPPVVANHPDIVYVVLGKTHPAVVRHSGEEYRAELQGLVKQLNLQDNVVFLNEFVCQNKLMKYLSAADIYVTPYLNEAQITSGTLAYAVGAGCAVVSTPYWHAAELLGGGLGRLFDFGNCNQLTSIFQDLLDNPELMQSLHNKARTYGRQTTWPRMGEKYFMVARRILEQNSWQAPVRETVFDPLMLPSFELDHIKRMTDSTGLIQHAKFGVPNLKEGYCLDDNARALLMVLMAQEQEKSPLASELLPVYLSYIHYMQNDNGSFRNFLSFSRHFLDEVGSEDSFGRTIWALGYLLGHAPNDTYHEYAREIFLKAAPGFTNLKHIRSIANTMIGISYYMESAPQDIEMKEKLRFLSNKLVDEYRKHAAPNWKWFEPVMTYDNAVIPLSLLHAADILKDAAIMKVATESMHFLSSVTLKNGHLSLVGNEEWFAKNSSPSAFAQQPLDAMAMVLMFRKAFEITKNEIYLNNMYTSFMWFLGENDLRLSLYDYESKGCCDGLEKYGVNRNQGAESTLAYLISHLALLQTFKAIGKQNVKIKHSTGNISRVKAL